MDPYHRESQVPPILQGDFAVPPPESSWPRVLGIISIVFGSLGLLFNLWNAVQPFFAEAIAKMMPQDPASKSSMDASLQAQKDYIPYIVLVALLCVIGSLMLLTGGIGLCRRARWGVKVTKIWIPWRIVCAVLSAIVGYVVMEPTLKAMAQQSNPAPFAG